MLQFPVLKTGAVAQYPLPLTFSYRADIVWFLDGSEQRFRNAPSVLHQWEIALNQLDEQEMGAVEQFFILSAGSAETFAFTDPASNATYPNCSVSGDTIDLEYVGPLSGKTKIVIRENRT
jgi:hypothetical protein